MRNPEIATAPEDEKPRVLYHATPHKNLEEIRPSSRTVRDPAEGQRVFATPELVTASLFINRNVKESGRYNDVPYAVIPMSREEFIAQDNGGTIYEFGSDGFEIDPKKGLGRSEWTSNQPVKPYASKEYLSALEFMLDQGVQVYFVTPDQHMLIRESEDHGIAVLKSLKSENELSNRNFTPLTDNTENAEQD